MPPVIFAPWRSFAGSFCGMMAYPPLMRALPTLLLTLAALFARLSAAEPAITPITTESRLEATIPISVRGLVLAQPTVTYLVSVDAQGKLCEYLPLYATHHLLLENADRALQKAKFLPATRDGQPVLSTGQVTVVLYDPNQRAYFSGGIDLPPANNLSDLVESRLAKIDKQQFVYRSSQPKELDRPLEVTATRIMLYQDAAGRPASGRCLVEFWVDTQGEPRFPRIVRSDNDAVSTSAILTLRQTHFSAPTRNGLPTYVQVRQPMEFNLDAQKTTAGNTPP